MQALAKLVLEIIIIWFSTIVASKLMSEARTRKMFKDLADRGYKFNYETLSQSTKEDIEEALEVEKTETIIDKILGMYPKIPFINILQVIMETISYNEQKDSTFEMLIKKDMLEEMNEIEKREYRKNPTGKNAHKISFNMHKRIERASIIHIEDGTIYYEIGELSYELDPPKKVEILKSTGSAKRLSKQEQIEIIIDFWKEYKENIIKEYGTIEKFYQCLEENGQVKVKIKSDEDEIKNQNEKTEVHHQQPTTKIPPKVVEETEEQTKPKTLTKKKMDNEK